MEVGRGCKRAAAGSFYCVTYWRGGSSSWEGELLPVARHNVDLRIIQIVRLAIAVTPILIRLAIPITPILILAWMIGHLALGSIHWRTHSHTCTQQSLSLTFSRQSFTNPDSLAFQAAAGPFPQTDGQFCGGQWTDVNANGRFGSLLVSR